MHASSSSAPADATPPEPLFRGRRPAELRFGTSGLRGLVADITDLEVYLNTRGFLDYIRQTGDPAIEQPVSVAADLRPSSDGPDRSIVRAVLAAIAEAGLESEFLGQIPTPALTLHGLRRRRLSIMVTGSHIPFDRNGIKFNKADGEVLKADEPGILSAVQAVREALYREPAGESRFADDGRFRQPPPPAARTGEQTAVEEYEARYREFLGSDALGGLRVVFYQHSAVGRDIMVRLLRRLGAEVWPMGRSESFVPIDTEALSAETLAALQVMVDEAVEAHGPIDAVVSTDGDSDRPLVAGVTAEGRVEFLPGDRLGMLVAARLGVDAVAVPVSANDGLDVWARQTGVTLRKTRIGSPHVIEAMAALAAAGSARVAGWEANGGFLTGSVLLREGRRLEPLPTRDAALPMLAALAAIRESGRPLTSLVDELPQRFGCAGLLDNFPPATSRRLLERFSPPDSRLVDVTFTDAGVAFEATGAAASIEGGMQTALQEIRRSMGDLFAGVPGLGEVRRLNYLDGIRVTFVSGEVVHIRPSGNAPQLRCYTVADSPARADQLLRLALAEPAGILRRIEAALG
ncbi:MAG: phosphomannomutase [Verrucomicrobiales bacterium]|nr:phosphomannomutase [Verrucomicrobiales bacterium]MCP5526669.1 phosphomannomutase [Verrucomicrobiales bacterium]